MSEIKIRDMKKCIQRISDDNAIVGFCLSQGCGGQFLPAEKISYKKAKRHFNNFGVPFYIIVPNDDLDYDMYVAVMS